MDVRTLLPRSLVSGSLGVAALLALTPVANAAFVFDFVAEAAGAEKGYATYIKSVGGVTLTATAFEGSGAASYVYLDDLSGGKPGGMGACTVLTAAFQCTPSDDDNVSDAEQLHWVLSGGDVDTLSLTFNDKDHNPFAGTIDIMIGAGPWTTTSVTANVALNLVLGSANTIKFRHMGSALTNAFYVSGATFEDDGNTDVPLPAAAWLLLSGVAGLGVIGRRRKAVTA